MPNLLAFVACERVAFDQANNSAILIGLFQGFTVTKMEKPGTDLAFEIPAGATPLSDITKVPIRWCAFSLWRKVPEDEGKDFEQRIDLVSPQGKLVVSATPLNFAMTHNFHRLTTHFSGFPVGDAGDYMVNLMFGEKGKELSQKASYPISVSLTPSAEAEPSKQ